MYLDDALLQATVKGLSDKRASALKQFLSSIGEEEETKGEEASDQERDKKDNTQLPLTDQPFNVMSEGDEPPQGSFGIDLSQLSIMG